MTERLRAKNFHIATIVIHYDCPCGMPDSIQIDNCSRSGYNRGCCGTKVEATQESISDGNGERIVITIITKSKEEQIEDTIRVG